MQIDRPILIIVILFAVIMLSFYVVFPKYDNLHNAQIELAKKKAEYYAQVDYYSEIKNRYDEIKEREGEIKIIDEALPKATDFGQLIYYLQKKAGESGLILKNLSLSQLAAGKTVKDIVFTLSLSGDYFSLENFLVSLERSARLFEVSRISFGSVVQRAKEESTEGKEGEGQSTPVVAQFQNSGIFSFSIEVKTYSY